MPVVVFMPSGSWGIGPSLLYLVGMVGALVYVLATLPKDHSHSHQDREKTERKRRADQSFEAALKAAAKERAGGRRGRKC